MVRGTNPFNPNHSPSLSTSETRRRVAVIGLGLAGCTAAHFLSKSGDEVVCYEALPCPGLYAHSVIVPSGNSTDPSSPSASTQETLCDVPLRAVSPHYYANYWKLLQYLDIPVQHVNYEGVYLGTGGVGGSAEAAASSPSSSSSSPHSADEHLTFGYRNYLLAGRFAAPLPVLTSLRHVRVLTGYLGIVFLMPMYLSTRRIGAAIAKLLPTARLRRWLTPTDPCDVSMEEYFTNGHGRALCGLVFHRDFTHGFFYPMMSTLLSCSYAQVRQYPAALLGEFLLARASTLLAGWFRVTGGVHCVANKLLRTDTPEAIMCHFNTRVVRVASLLPNDEDEGKEGGAGAGAGATAERTSNRGVVELTVKDPLTGAERTEVFDAVVVAVEPDVARRIVVPASAAQKALVECADTYTAEIVAHRDPALMPTRRDLWAPINVYGDDDEAESTHRDGLASTTTAHFSAILAEAKKRGGVPSKAQSPVPPSAPNDKAAGEGVFGPSSLGGLKGGGGGGGGEVFETWNPRSSPKEDSVIKKVKMTRSVWGVKGFATFRRVAPSAQGAGGIYFAGSYCARGVTLLEQACTSGLEAALDLGASVPFSVYPGMAPAPLNPILVAISCFANVVARAVACPLSVLNFICGIVAPRSISDAH